MSRLDEAIDDPKHFKARKLKNIGGLWFCTVRGCDRSKLAFDDARSAKSHPWPAHGIRSSAPSAARRRKRRAAWAVCPTCGGSGKVSA